MAYSNLIDIGLNVDTSELDNRLADLVTEDRVQEMLAAKVEEYISDAGITEDRVQEIVRDLMHSEGEDFVQGVIDSGSYVTEWDMDSKIDEKIGEIDPTLSDEEVRDIVHDVFDHDVNDLSRRLDVYANKADSVRTFEDRIEALEAKLDALSAKSAEGLTLFDLLTQAARILGILR